MALLKVVIMIIIAINCISWICKKYFLGMRSLSSAAIIGFWLELKNLNDWLTTNKLSLNIAKTEFMMIGSRQRINASQNNIDIRIDDREVKRVHSTKSLGLHIDSNLTWSVHIEKVCKKISSAIGALKRIRSFITTRTAVEVYFALIQPHFDYCCSVWDGLG